MDQVDNYISLFDHIKHRIEYLKTVVVPEEQCTPVSESSETDFYQFLDKIHFTRRPLIYLLDSGNLRAVWINISGEKASFTFLGDTEVSLYLNRPNLEVSLYHVSKSVLSNTKSLSDHYDFSGLLFEE